MTTDLAEHRNRFLRYAEGFSNLPDAAPLRLKIEHTFKVLEHARRIVEELPHENSVSRKLAHDKDAERAALLASLYHDCGRFLQFTRYRTFLDARSINHAELGVQVMRDEGFLRGETDRVQGLVRCAVLLHNRHILPPMLREQARFVTDIVRDSDKLDIFRIMVAHLTQALPERDAVLLHVEDAPSRWSKGVEDAVLHGRVASYADIHFINDFRLLLGTWMSDMRYEVTRRVLASSGLMETVLAPLGKLPGLRHALDILYSQLEDCRHPR